MNKRFAFTALLALAMLAVSCSGEIPAADCADGDADCQKKAGNDNWGLDAITDPNVECTVNLHCGDGHFCYEGKCYEEKVLAIKTLTLPPAIAENSYDFQFEAFYGVEPLEWLIVGTLPEGLKYDMFGHVTGTPVLDSVGEYPLKVTVFDAAGAQASATYVLTVKEPNLYITTKELPTGQQNAEYSAQIEVAFGTAPFQWRLVGELPPGLNLSESGLISGVPEIIGTFTFTIKVYDSSDPVNSASRELSITIDPLPLKIKAGIFSYDLSKINQALSGYSLSILMPAIGNYKIQLGAEGGLPPYTWAEDNNPIVSLAMTFLGISVAMPEGLTLSESGVISGTPSGEPSSFTIPGTQIALKGYIFMATVTDQNGDTATGLFLIPVIDLNDLLGLLGGLGGLGNLPF